jgi:hypothetical protein
MFRILSFNNIFFNTENIINKKHKIVSNVYNNPNVFKNHVCVGAL